MSLTAAVTLSGVEQSTGTLVAFAGTEVRGMQDSVTSPAFGPYAEKALYQVTVYADTDGELLNFQFHVGGLKAAFTETTSFETNGSMGNVIVQVMRLGFRCDESVYIDIT
jgi:hypothetical protein